MDTEENLKFDLPLTIRDSNGNTGRPSKYSIALGTALLSDIATDPRPIRSICTAHGISNAVLYAWCSASRDFADTFRVACALRGDSLVDSVDEDLETLCEYVKTSSDDAREKHVRVASARLQTDFRRWLSGKLNPRYADRPVDVTVNVQSDARAQAWQARKSKAVEAQSADVPESEG